MHKSLRSTLVLAIALVPFWGDSHTRATAQERQGCYMVDDTGQLIDLAPLCPVPEPFVSSSSEPTLGTGDIQVTLRWTTVDDLDLAVTDPNGDTVYYGNRSIASSGQLDVDANAACSEADSSPIENIFWPPSQAPQGQFTAAVNLYTRCTSSADPIPFEIRLLVQGNVQTLTGTVSDASPTVTFPFSLPPQ